MTALIFSLSPFTTKAEEPLVEVRTMDNVFKSYKERRGTHGFLLSISGEDYLPKDYVSRIDAENFETMFGDSTMPVYSGEIGYKFNFVLGSLSALVGYGYGRVSFAGSGEERVLEFHRTTGRLMYIMDNFLAEPYAAPYFSFGIYDLGIEEKIPTLDASFSGQTKIGTLMTAGLLLQLNWIEPDTSREAYIGAGLENMYLDLFVTQLNATTSDEDPNTQSGFNVGAGLRLEF
ncbi:MAG: hypothetical protein KF802_09565 [Bdellovibrionaceae bacterium]|nr:hypothetical protein [Pseudobdellovibrionaceae bacterium]MBX3033635.1 hypothetical protein [Pseudobdellovibrionaceae bacterium]